MMWKSSTHLQTQSLSAVSANVSWTTPRRAHVGTSFAKYALSSGLMTTTVARHAEHGCPSGTYRMSSPWFRTWSTNWWCIVITVAMVVSRSWCWKFMMLIYRSVISSCCSVQMLAVMWVSYGRISRNMWTTFVNFGRWHATRDVILKYQLMTWIFTTVW